MSRLNGPKLNKSSKLSKSAPKMTSCKMIVAVAMVLTVLGSMAEAILSCQHPLRISAPYLFPHCKGDGKCTYSKWEGMPNSKQAVSTTQCKSGYAFKEIRTSTCSKKEESRRVCFPDREDQMILSLGLGSSGRNLKPIKSRKTTLESYLEVLLQGDTRKCPFNNNVGRVCHHLAGKRSATASLIQEFTPAENIDEETEAAPMLDEAPIPFNMVEHGARLRRQGASSQCGDDDIQHILFVLDSSGSIGSTSYQRMKDAIGKLVPLFCSQIQTALVDFGTNINLEYCFDCFDNTYNGRTAAKNAISKAQYHNSMTNTGATAKCICDELLNSDCGISRTPECLDVVFITDGQSNDPKYKICNEVKCLHQRTGISTYAIGINNYKKAELDCISHSSSLMNAFKYESFKDFEDSIEDIIRRLAANPTIDGKYSCVKRDSTLGSG